jgi:hypothetical protein
LLLQEASGHEKTKSGNGGGKLLTVTQQTSKARGPDEGMFDDPAPGQQDVTAHRALIPQPTYFWYTQTVALNRSRRDFHGYALHRLLHQESDHGLHATRLLIESNLAIGSCPLWVFK